MTCEPPVSLGKEMKLIKSRILGSNNKKRHKNNNHDKNLGLNTKIEIITYSITIQQKCVY